MKTDAQELQKNPDRTFVITCNAPLNLVLSEYQKALQNFQANFDSKGFRKGKTPINLVEQSVGQSKIIEESATHVLSSIYNEKVKQYQLQPIIQPIVKINNLPLSLDKEWQIVFTSCELPQIKVDPKYVTDIKTLNLANKNNKDADNDLLNKILDTLLKSIKADLPTILVDHDVQNRLADLVDQSQSAGITVDQYLQSRKTTLEQYTQSLKQQISQEWLLNLAINQIATEQHFQVNPDEIKDLTAKNPKLATNPTFATYLLLQQKVLDYLKDL